MTLSSLRRHGVLLAAYSALALYAAVVVYLVAAGHLLYQSQGGAHELLLTNVPGFSRHALWVGYLSDEHSFYVGGY